MWFVCKKLRYLLLALVFFATGFSWKISDSFAATVNIPASTIIAVSNPAISNNDDIVFIGSTSGTLQIDVAKQLSTLTTAGTEIGNVDFTSANTLTLTGIAGTSVNQINRINFGSFDGTLDAKGATNSAAVGIITGTNNVGNLIFSGAVAQTVDSSIGSASISGGLKLKSVTISNTAGVTFSKNIYATTFTANENTTINGTGTIDIGTFAIADSKTIALSNNATIGTIATNNTGIINFGTNKTVTITGNITGAGTIQTAVNNTGALTFLGTSAQTVSANIGSSSVLKINSVAVSNSSGVTFGKNLYLNSLVVNEAATINGAGTVDITAATIANSKTLTLSNDATIGSVATNSSGILNFGANKTATITGNITGSGSIKTASNGTGALSFTGITAQTIGNQIGVSGTKLASISIANTDSTKLVTFNKDVYAASLTTSNNSNITFSGSSAQIVDAAIGLTGARFTNLTVSNSNGVNFKDNVFTSALAVTGALSLDSGKIITTNGNISGAGIIYGAGNLTLDSAATAQSVAATIGNSSSDKFGTITITSTGGTSFSKNIYAASIIGVGKNIIFNGSGAQTVDSILGASGSNLNQVTLNNSGGAVFNQNIFTDNFLVTSGRASLSGSSISLGSATVSSGGALYIANNATTGTLTSPGIISIASSKTLTASGNTNISGTLNVSVESLGVGLLNGGNVTIADGSTINVDYSNISSNPVISGNKIILNATSLTATMDNITSTDNSYLLITNFSKVGNQIQVSNQIDSSAVQSLGTYNSGIVQTILNSSTTSGNMNAVKAKMLSLTNTDDIKTASESLTAPRNNMNAMTAFAISDQVLSVIDSYSIPVNSGLDEKNKTRYKKTIWGEVFHNQNNQDKKEEITGYKNNVNGFVFGSDRLIKFGDNNYVFGVAAAYGHGKASSKSSTRQNSFVDSYQIALYNNNFGKSGLGFYNKNTLYAAIDQYKTVRIIEVGTFKAEADGKFSGNQHGFKTSIGYGIKIANEAVLSPNVGLHYSRLSQGNYTENGAGDVGLIVKNNDVNRLISEVGTSFATKIFMDEYDITLLPKVNLSWLHNFKSKGQESTFAFISGGSEINNVAPNLPQNLFNMDLEFNLPLEDNYDSFVTLKYKLQAGSAFMSNAGYISYNYLF